MIGLLKTKSSGCNWFVACVRGTCKEENCEKEQKKWIVNLLNVTSFCFRGGELADTE